MTAPPLAAVTWDDAKATAVEEYDLNEIKTQFHRPARYTTYGLLVVSDDCGVTLATERRDDGSLRGLTFIPRAMVRDTAILSAKPRRARTLKTQETPLAGDEGRTPRTSTVLPTARPDARDPRPEERGL